MSSLKAALTLLENAASAVVGLPVIQKPAGLAFVDPLGGAQNISVRRGGMTAGQGGSEFVTQNFVTVGNRVRASEVITAPTVSLRVFLDIRHGRDEVAHLTALGALAGRFPPGSLRWLDATTALSTDSIDPTVTGEVYVTTLTGRLTFELTEAATTVTGVTLERVTVTAHNADLLDPPLETIEVIP